MGMAQQVLTCSEMQKLDVVFILHVRKRNSPAKERHLVQGHTGIQWQRPYLLQSNRPLSMKCIKQYTLIVS